jgi:hypothetical protein
VRWSGTALGCADVRFGDNHKMLRPRFHTDHKMLWLLGGTAYRMFVPSSHATQFAHDDSAESPWAGGIASRKGSDKGSG